MQSTRFIWTLCRKFPLLLLVNTVLLTITSLVDATTLFCVAPIVDLLLVGDATSTSLITQHARSAFSLLGVPYTLTTVLVVFVALNFIKSGFQVCATYLALKTKYVFLRDILLGAFEDFFGARWPFFCNSRQGDLLNTFTREVGCAADAFGAMVRFFSSLLQLAVFMAVPFYLSWETMAVSIGITLLFAIPLMISGSVTYRLGLENTRTSNRMASVIQESLSAAKLVIGYGNQSESIGELANAFDAHRKATLKSQTIQLSVPYLYFPFGLVVLIVTMITARSLALPLSEISILIYALFRITPIVGLLLGHKAAMDGFFPSYEQIQALRKQAVALAQKSGTKPFDRFDHEITLADVTFAHPGHAPALIGLNASIPKGRMIAFVGESGAGKSTLIDMIMGFHQPDAGAIAIDGEPLERFDIHSYRKRIGYVPQDSVLFNMSIRDNLLWANRSASEDEILKACHLANAHAFITSLTHGYNTMVGDRGVRLSGGQVQRIALARAILRKPLLLILDEATSSLDSHSEKLIQQAIEKIARETTVIVVAHRLSTISNSDYIYVLEDGKLLEQGTFDKLVGQSGTFHKMLRLQDVTLANINAAG